MKDTFSSHYIYTYNHHAINKQNKVFVIIFFVGLFCAILFQNQPACSIVSLKV